MIEIFATSVETEEQAGIVLKYLQEGYPTYKINFDLEDCDNILRVENFNDKINVKGIKRILTALGFKAEVLPDIPVKISQLLRVEKSK